MTVEERYNDAMSDRDPWVYGWLWTPWADLDEETRSLYREVFGDDE
ncbi:hypothetical protein ACWEF6_01880 [Amycolatopsis sp. NPDC004772]